MYDDRPSTYDPDAPPPPPNLAQRLVGRSGFTVYEEGRNLFDHPVLVYEAIETLPDFSIHDHIGRPLGRTVLLGKRRRYSRGTYGVRDQIGRQKLEIGHSLGAHDETFPVSGEVSGGVHLTGLRYVIRQGPNRLGAVVGVGLRPHLGREFEILGVGGRAAGRIEAHEQFRTGRTPVYSYVMSVDPVLRGPLRKMLVAMPTVLALARGFRG